MYIVTTTIRGCDSVSVKPSPILNQNSFWHQIPGSPTGVTYYYFPLHCQPLNSDFCFMSPTNIPNVLLSFSGPLFKTYTCLQVNKRPKAGITSLASQLWANNSSLPYKLPKQILFFPSHYSVQLFQCSERGSIQITSFTNTPT